MPSFVNSFKILMQLGIKQPGLYALYKLGLITGHYRRMESRLNVERSAFNALFTLPPRGQLTQILGEKGMAALLTEADEILNGQFRMFGGEPVAIKLAFDKPLSHWTDYETGKASALDLQPLDELRALPSTLDLKLIWEPARFGWAFALGRAYYLAQDEKYAEAFWKYFETFTAGNPPGLGPHWMNGQEVAIRMMALVWAAHIFTPDARRAQLAASIYHHAARIPSTLVYARSQNNNHLVTEAAAIYTAGLFFSHQKWRALGWRWLNWALQHQIGGYGEYIQHSANYHRLMLQTALWVNFIKQDVWSAGSSQALARSAHWLFSLLDNESGRTPNLGANDGALVFPLSAAPFNDFRPTVQAAARAFLRTQVEPGAWDEMSLWFGLPPAKKTHDPEHYLSDHLRGRESWGYLRASGFRSRLSHSDQLHLDLWWRGLNIAQDAGTYLYNAPPPWDNPLVTTRVHNTVTVDGRDQMTRAGRFLMLDWVDAYSKPEISTDESILQRVTANHKGYHGVKHERTVTVFTDERWLIEDKLTSRRAHTCRLHWLLPDWKWKMENGELGVEIGLLSPHGWVILRVSTQHASHITLIRAGELIQGEQNVLPFEGWISPAYGTKLPALSFAVEAASLQNVTFTSEFVFP